MDRRRESIFFGCFFPWNHNFTLNVWSMSQSFVAHNFCFLLSGFLFPLILAHSIFSCVSLFNHFIIFFPFSGQNFCGDLVMMRLLYTHSIFHIKFEKKIPFLIEICVRFGGQVYISFREKIFALRRISRFYGILRKTRIRWYFQYFACILDYFDTPNLFEKSSFLVCVCVCVACLLSAWEHTLFHSLGKMMWIWMKFSGCEFQFQHRRTQSTECFPNVSVEFINLD